MKEVNEKYLRTLQGYFKRSGYTKNTMKRWTEIAVQYISFLEQNGRTVDDIGDLLNSEGKVVKKEEFGMREFLDTKTRFSTGYMNYLCHAMKTIYEAWEKHFPIPNKKFPKVSGEPKRVVLREEQLGILIKTAQRMWLESVAKDDKDINGLRDYCMVLISVDCGARRYQINQLDCDSYDVEKNVLLVPPAKGGRKTERVLDATTRNALLFYLQKRRQIQTAEKAMFLKKRSTERITTELMSDAFRAISKRAGVYVKGLGFHAPRRGKTRRLAEGGLREDEINDVMGWKVGSRMSHVYINIDQDEVQRKAAEADKFFKKSDKKDIKAA